MNEKIPAVLNSYVGDDTDLCYYVFDILRQEEKPEVGQRNQMQVKFWRNIIRLKN